MLNEISNLKNEVGSLELLISALSSDLAEQREHNRSSDGLLTEMEEALCELRRERGFKKVLLSALDNRR
ncbi:MAG: hypothetical protein L0229_13850 [Blastocatellia bacterium]|nr:hypothetical protein [Blastocatellia bacterium]